MKITLNVILAISFGAIALLVLLFVIRRRKEGFEDAQPSPHQNPAIQGIVPEASQISAIPTDVAAATTTNTSVSLAQPKDIQAIEDSFNTLKLLILTKDPSTTDLDNDTKSQLQNIKENLSSIENSIKTSYTNPDITGTSVSKATEQRTKYDSLTSKARQHPHYLHKIWAQILIRLAILRR
jgi:Fe2+ transport system protein B